jgi:hypothetical protein
MRTTVSWRDSDPSEWGGTVRTAGVPPAGSNKTPAGASGTGSAPVSGSHDSGDGGEEARAVYRRLPYLQGLSVDVGHVPGNGAAAGLPQGSGAVPEVTILRRFSRQESSAAAKEGDAALNRLFVPALQSLAPVREGPEQVRAQRGGKVLILAWLERSSSCQSSRPVQNELAPSHSADWPFFLFLPSPLKAAVDAVALQMQQLERQCPGSSARLLSEAMLQLSISDNPLLAKLQATARGLFGSSAGGGGAPAVMPVAAAWTPGGVPNLSGPALPGFPARSRTGLEKPAGTAAALLPNAETGRIPSAAAAAAAQGPDLGLLGNFLLARWREDAARAAAAAARSRTAL